MHTEILTSAEEVFRLRREWESLHRATAGPVSMSYPWLSAWWSVFGDRFRIRVLAGWEQNRLVGLFPCFLEGFSLLRIRATRLRFLGEYSILAEYHPLVEQAFEEEFVRAAADFCETALREGVCDLIDVHSYPSGLPFMQRWIRLMRERRVIMSVRDRVVPRVRIDLPKSLPEYLARLSQNGRHHFRKKQRILAEAGVRCVCVTRWDDDAAFQDYVRLSVAMWARRGGRSYYAARSGFERFQKEVTASLLKEGKARLYFLEKDGDRFAALHVFLMNGVFQAYLGGRNPSHPLSRWSPGLVLMGHAITDAIGQGFEQFDFLTGDHPYKYSLGGTIHGWHGRATAAFRGIRGWKGVMMILFHNMALFAGRNRYAGLIVKCFDQISARGKSGHPPRDNAKTIC